MFSSLTSVDTELLEFEQLDLRTLSLIPRGSAVRIAESRKRSIFDSLA